jgi:hypothetical protein
MTAAERYVAGAYLVVFLMVLVYVLIIALKLARLEQALAEAEATVSATSSPPEPGKRPERSRCPRRPRAEMTCSRSSASRQREAT